MDFLILNKNFDKLSHNIDDYPEGIVIPIDKPYRWTSADVIRKIKYAAIRHFGKKNLKVGHAGTLDPLATGVLLVCIGKATKMAETLQAHDKEYEAGITFGATTPSYDLEKEIDRFFPYEHISRESVEAALPAFIGEQDQIAPLFSAKSVDGVRAYELARKLYKEGGSIDEAAAELIRTARITISELELLAFNEATCTSQAMNKCPVDICSAQPAAAGRRTITVIPGTDHTSTDHTVIPGTDHTVIPGTDPTSADHTVIPGTDHTVIPGTDPTSADHTVIPGTDPTSAGCTVIPGTDRESTPTEKTSRNASSRINVTDNTALGLPRAIIRMACSKGTYVRAFARDLGETLESGAHLDALRRTRSGIFRASEALTVDDAIRILANE